VEDNLLGITEFRGYFLKELRKRLDKEFVR